MIISTPDNYILILTLLKPLLSIFLTTCIIIRNMKALAPTTWEFLTIFPKLFSLLILFTLLNVSIAKAPLVFIELTISSTKAKSLVSMLGFYSVSIIKPDSN